MSSSWLEKEEEYRKLNEELQRRNKMLMEEFDTVLKKQDNLLKESQESQMPYKLNRNSYSFVQNQVKVFDYNTKENFEKLPSGKIEVAGIPDTVDQMGVKGMSSFYRAKIKAMQSDHDKLQIEWKNKCEEVKKIQKENTKLSEDKEKWFQAYNLNKTTINKLENQITGLNVKCQSKDNENVSLRKDIEHIKKEFKNTSLNVSGSELRLNRALEDNEKIKNALKISKQEEKDLKDAHKKEIQDLSNTIKVLEKQKNEILTSYKKQMQLVDNLKKQKTLIEALKVGQLSENEFMKILDWKIE